MSRTGSSAATDEPEEVVGTVENIERGIMYSKVVTQDAVYTLPNTNVGHNCNTGSQLKRRGFSTYCY